MIKHYCDGCGKELTERNSAVGGHMVKSRLGIEVMKNGRLLKVELLLTSDNVANAGDWCKYCILDAFSQLDDRAKLEPEYPRALR